MTYKYVKEIQNEKLREIITDILDKYSKASLYEDDSKLYHLIWEPLKGYFLDKQQVLFSPVDLLCMINLEVIAEGHFEIRDSESCEAVPETDDLLLFQFTNLRDARAHGHGPWQQLFHVHGDVCCRMQADRH